MPDNLVITIPANVPNPICKRAVSGIMAKNLPGNPPPLEALYNVRLTLHKRNAGWKIQYVSLDNADIASAFKTLGFFAANPPNPILLNNFAVADNEAIATVLSNPAAPNNIPDAEYKDVEDMLRLVDGVVLDGAIRRCRVIVAVVIVVVVVRAGEVPTVVTAVLGAVPRG